jgi:hypothetical protein
VVWIGTYNTRFQYYGNAEVFPDRGYLRFEDRRALTNRPAWYAGMYDALSPVEANSQVRFSLSYRAPAQNYISLGHPNILPNSVVVVRNGRVMADSEYNVNLYSGRITFNAAAAGGQGREYYQCSPFGSSLQRVLVGRRADYTFREGSHPGRASPIRAGRRASPPRVAVDSPIHRRRDTQLDLVALLARKRNNDWSVNAPGIRFQPLRPQRARRGGLQQHGARIPNTPQRGEAISELLFHGEPPPRWRREPRLGKSYFVDFNLYNLGHPHAVSFDLLNEMSMRSNNADSLVNRRQDVNFQPFDVRPGPFQVYGATLVSNPEQSSLLRLRFRRALQRGTSLGTRLLRRPRPISGPTATAASISPGSVAEIVYSSSSVDAAGIVGDGPSWLVRRGQPTEASTARAGPARNQPQRPPRLPVQFTSARPGPGALGGG